ncbi:hypothetical protein FWH13_03010 [Candidatus Saccharibacteria bacterium]|nr:hypothetical protein [Candidatus Saccharibacteria bacterium]
MPKTSKRTKHSPEAGFDYNHPPQNSYQGLRGRKFVLFRQLVMMAGGLGVLTLTGSIIIGVMTGDWSIFLVVIDKVVVVLITTLLTQAATFGNGIAQHYQNSQTNDDIKEGK